MQDPLVILEAVNKFYTDSFNQLIILTVAILTFSGVLMPLIISSLQKRFFKLEHKEIEAELEQVLETKIKNHIEKVEEEYKRRETLLEKKIDKLELKLSKELAGNKGTTSHLITNIHLRDNNYQLAFGTAISATNSHLKSKNDTNLNRVLMLMIKNCLPNLTKIDFENDPEISLKYEKMLIKLQDYNSTGKYSDEIQNLKFQYNQATKRVVESQHA